MKPARTPDRHGTVHVIGIPPGQQKPSDPEALAILERTDLIFAGGALSSALSGKGRRVERLGAKLEEILGPLKKRVENGEEAVVLATGDPDFYGIAKFLVRNLGKERVRVYPAVTSMQLAFSRIGESWEDALFLSAHARPLDKVVEKVKERTKVCVLTSDGKQPAELAASLLSRGLDTFRMYVFERLGFPEERVHDLDLARASRMEFDPLNLVIMIREGDPPSGGHNDVFVTPDEKISRIPGHENKMTKFEVRAVALAKLMLKPADTMWDIGAGTGALSIDASRWLREGRVYAVEKEERNLEVIWRNVIKFGALNVYPVHARAPDLPRELPDPDAVFIGGGGGSFKEIVTSCLKRLNPGGRLVCSLVDLQRVSQGMDILEGMGLNPECTVVQVYTGRGNRGLRRLEPLNPVFLISATQEGGREG